jgi:hypothetical protein
MRKQLLDTVYAHAFGHIKKHLANIEVLLEHSTGVTDDTDIVNSIKHELSLISKYDSELDMFDSQLGKLDKYLIDETENNKYVTTIS